MVEWFKLCYSILQCLLCLTAQHSGSLLLILRRILVFPFFFFNGFIIFTSAFKEPLWREGMLPLKNLPFSNSNSHATHSLVSATNHNRRTVQIMQNQTRWIWKTSCPISKLYTGSFRFVCLKPYLGFLDDRIANMNKITPILVVCSTKFTLKVFPLHILLNFNVT